MTKKTIQHYGPIPSVPADRFIEVWNAASCPSQAAKKLKITLNNAKRRAYRLRLRGHDLKNFHNYHRPKGQPSGKPLIGKEYAKAIREGSSVSEVASQYGITKQGVRIALLSIGYSTTYDTETRKTRLKKKPQGNNDD